MPHMEMEKLISFGRQLCRNKKVKCVIIIIDFFKKKVDRNFPGKLKHLSMFREQNPGKFNNLKQPINSAITERISNIWDNTTK